MMRPPVTGLLLAGGAGRRVGGADKGLLPYRGRPLVAWVLERLAPQVDRVLISANRNDDEYRDFGHEVIGDRLGGHAGPLAGLQAGLAQAHTPFLACVPCDSPHLPADLVFRLHAALHPGADLSYARAGGHDHHVFCLLRRELAPELDRFLAGGGRKVALWQAGLRSVAVDFDDAPGAFRNLNTPEDFAGAA